MDLIIPKGDKGYYLNFTIVEADGSPFDLTGYSIKLRVWKAGKPNTLLVNGTCDPINEKQGTCSYLVGASDFLTRGKFRAELEMTKKDVIESTEYFVIRVTESS